MPRRRPARHRARRRWAAGKARRVGRDLWAGWTAPLHVDDPVRVPGKKPGGKPASGPPDRDGTPFTGTVIDGDTTARPNNPPAPADGPIPARSSDMRIFQGVVDATNESASRWEPTNDDGQVAAQEMRVLVRELPDVLEALSGAMKVMAGKATDSIWMDSSTAELLHGMADYLARPIDSLNDSAQAMDRPHNDDLERIHREDPRAAAWDWERNQGYAI